MTDCYEFTVARILFTTAKRCSYVINSRGWKCKKPPLWIWESIAVEPDGRHRAHWVCDEHNEALRCPDEAVPA